MRFDFRRRHLWPFRESIFLAWLDTYQPFGRRHWLTRRHLLTPPPADTVIGILKSSMVSQARAWLPLISWLLGHIGILRLVSP